MLRLAVLLVLVSLVYAYQSMHRFQCSDVNFTGDCSIYYQQNGEIYTVNLAVRGLDSTQAYECYQAMLSVHHAAPHSNSTMPHSISEGVRLSESIRALYHCIDQYVANKF